jgi:hypothetical protein
VFSKQARARGGGTLFSIKIYHYQNRVTIGGGNVFAKLFLYSRNPSLPWPHGMKSDIRENVLHASSRQSFGQLVFSAEPDKQHD